MSNFEEITAEAFGQEILRWLPHVETPLEVISLYKHFDDYLPAIKKYNPAGGEEVTFILGGSYPSRQTSLSVIGSIWDLAEAK
jgi:hypothetical protein